MYQHEKRIVMTLDAGGTNFVFSAIRGNQTLIEPIRRSAETNSIELCLKQIIDGFESVCAQLSESPVAISFAFPGPADYRNGIIGDLPNFPAFRGGVALGPMLERHFKIPVYINNDGHLYAYGEALAGALPMINKLLSESGSIRQYRNLLGITLGTGFGGGIVINNQLIHGDNGSGAELWCMQHPMQKELIAEESVSIRGLLHTYHQQCPNDSRQLTPKDLYLIAEGEIDGDRHSAISAFHEMGLTCGAIIASALKVIDGIAVIGGGIANASKYIAPGIIEACNSQLHTRNGLVFSNLQNHLYYLNDTQQMNEFLKDKKVSVPIPLSIGKAVYNTTRKTGIYFSQFSTSEVISIGAYNYALHQIDNH